ncbi:MAG: low specificity L-threonine aldolase [Bauldia sp.]|nr:low specificity L-threonine aldolase [Bauldia sp.]
MNFASDNWAGAHPAIAAALQDAAGGFEPAYGGDRLTKAVEAEFARIFGRDVAVFFVGTGTAANSLALAALGKPGGLVFCHEGAHINTDEGSAPEYLSGCKLIGIPGVDGRLTAAALAETLARFPPNPVRYGQPAAVSLSNLTEYGTAYAPPDIAAIANVAHDAGLGVHLDGARFGNAVAAIGVPPAALSAAAGVDVMSFGGSKAGCFAAEAVLFFDPARAAEFPFLRKRSGHLFSKSRFIAAQFLALLEDDLWLDLARHANAMAAQLREAVTAAGGRLAWPAMGNEVFVILPQAMAKRAADSGARFGEWDAEPGMLSTDEVLIRLVTCFATTDAEVDAFARVLRT